MGPGQERSFPHLLLKNKNISLSLILDYTVGMLQWLKSTWKRIPDPVRKFCVFVLGWLVVLAGVAMLALPGPGWAAIFLGFAILATEFTTARDIRDWMVTKLKAVIHWFKRTVFKKQ